MKAQRVKQSLDIISTPWGKATPSAAMELAKEDAKSNTVFYFVAGRYIAATGGAKNNEAFDYSSHC